MINGKTLYRRGLQKDKDIPCCKLRGVRGLMRSQHGWLRGAAEVWLGRNLRVEQTARSNNMARCGGEHL